jgi:hypothetical protein
MDRILIALLALSGGLFAALLGWLDSNEPFDPRKFGGSAIRSLVAALVFAVGYQLAQAQVTVLDLFIAFLGGAGVDAIGNRIAGKLGNGSWPLPTGK